MTPIFCRLCARPLKCDFCSSTEPPFIENDCRDFEMDEGYGSLSSWLACGTCQAFIDTEDRKALNERQVEAFTALAPEAADFRMLLGVRLMLITDGFFRHRTGATVALQEREHTVACPP